MSAAIAGVVKSAEFDGLSVELLGQADSAIVSAVGDENRRGAVRKQVPRRQFAHLSGADQVNVLALQRSENLLGQFDRDRGHRNGRRAYRGFRAHSLGYGESAGQQQIQLRVHRAYGARRRIGFLHLAENLRLADHHRIEARGDAEKMTNGFALAIFIKVRLEFGGIELKIFAQKTAQIGAAILGLRQQFHPVAGGENQPFFDTRMLQPNASKPPAGGIRESPGARAPRPARCCGSRR